MIQLSDTSPQPLRHQIVGQVRELILSGTLGEHTRLPSIRSLAREQRVGVVTVQRAFEDLEREGMIYARQGKGYFVAPLAEDVRGRQARELTRRSLEAPLREARAMGLEDEEIAELVQAVLAGKGDDQP
jgi:GntR family transcriptional regulator